METTTVAERFFFQRLRRWFSSDFINFFLPGFSQVFLKLTRAFLFLGLGLCKQQPLVGIFFSHFTEFFFF